MWLWCSIICCVFCKIIFAMEETKRFVELAKIAEQAERYEDMAKVYSWRGYDLGLSSG